MSEETEGEWSFEKVREKWLKVMLERGHKPIMDSCGTLDTFAYTPGTYHNGPGCERCHWACCMHCDPDPNIAVPMECVP